MSVGVTFIGHGSSFNLMAGSPLAATATCGFETVSFGSNKIDVTDTTDTLTAGTQRTFIAGLENPGDCTLKMKFKPGDTAQGALIAAKDSSTHHFKVLYPGTVGSDNFDGIITGIDREIPDDKPATITMKIQITGPMIFTAGS